MYRKSLLAILSGLFVVCTSSAHATADVWRTRAVLQVPSPGIVETVVPPQLIYSGPDGALNLTLTGPDGNSRGFELYWREPLADVKLSLTPVRVTLNDQQGFVWEADLPQKIITHRVIVELADKAYIGKINVYHYAQDQWHPLVRDAAVFNTQGTLYGRIDLPTAPYERLRLVLNSLDRRARKTVSPIKRVVVEGEKMGKDYAVQTIGITFQQAQVETETVVTAALPGNGIWINALELATEAQFQGTWQLGRDSIVDGTQRFIVIKSGTVAHVDRNQQTLRINIDQPWQGSSIVLKLDTDQKYIGEVKNLRVKVRLPRLVFAPERQGTYTLFTGGDQKASVHSHPGDALRHPDFEIATSGIETNAQWQPASLVERFRIQGAAFDPAGYTWRTTIQVVSPGYYQLAMNLEAILKSNTPYVRIVQNDLQVPYILGRIENQTIELTAKQTLDDKNNQSQWVLQLPGPSKRWQNITLHAQGIFRRTVQCQRSTPGNMGWQPWRTVTWENHDPQQTAMTVSLRGFPQDLDRLRILVNNGDNQPIELSNITAQYAAPTYYFLAHQPGTYTIYGGNPESTPPRYDLSLVQNELLRVLPKKVEMGSPEIFRKPGWQQRFTAAFKGSGWGLYIALGLVTIVLLFVIVRLFPKTAHK